MKYTSLLACSALLAAAALPSFAQDAGLAEPAPAVVAEAPAEAEDTNPDTMSKAQLAERAAGMWQDSGLYGFLTAEPRDWAVDTRATGVGEIDAAGPKYDKDGNTTPAALVGEDGALH